MWHNTYLLKKGMLLMKARKAQKIRNYLFVIGIVLMLCSNISDFLFIIGVVVTLSGLIPDFLYNRCPHCKKLLGRNEAAFCQHCGGKID